MTQAHSWDPDQSTRSETHPFCCHIGPFRAWRGCAQAFERLEPLQQQLRTRPEALALPPTRIASLPAVAPAAGSNGGGSADGGAGGEGDGSDGDCAAG